MKKIILLASVITVASFASCKKAVKCECTTTVTSQTYNGSNSLGNTTMTNVSTRDIAKTSKKTAEAICAGGTSTDTYSQPSGSTTNTQITNSSTTCAIK